MAKRGAWRRPEAGAPQSAPNVRDTAWFAFVEEIESLLRNGRYGQFETLLRGIASTVQRQERVTARQRQTLRRIEASHWVRRW
jgi:hypothetical protein